MSYTYDDSGIRTSKTVNGTKTQYYLNGSTILTQITGDNRFDFFYDENGLLLGFSYNGAKYYYIRNLQSDIIGILDNSGNQVVSYTYDSWGKLLSIEGSAKDTIGVQNPFRYRGYYYDTETGFYYLNSRYYDPAVGRWLSPEPNVYTNGFDNGAGLTGYNVYSYCANNPISFSDSKGEFIFTAIIVGAIAGALIGGVVGGIAAYKSAKSSGSKGSDLFWKTAKGIGKGMVIGGVAGGLGGAAGGVVATYGAGSIAGTAAISSTATVAARTTEVVTLQTRKSVSEQRTTWQIVDDNINSVFSNGGSIIAPMATKAATTSVSYLYKDMSQYKVTGLSFNNYMRLPGGHKIPYIFSGYAWFQTINSIGSDNPIARAEERGYTLY